MADSDWTARRRRICAFADAGIRQSPCECLTVIVAQVTVICGIDVEICRVLPQDVPLVFFEVAVLSLKLLKRL